MTAIGTPLATVAVGDCRIVVWSPEYIETVFPDGRTCPAQFVEDDAARATARDLGYGDDVARMHVEHEIAHTVLAQLGGQPHSPVLYHVAGGTPASDADRAAEEGVVMEFQRAMAAVRRVATLVMQARWASPEERLL